MITCSRVGCGVPATRGGLLVVQPNGLRTTHATYYACGNDTEILAKAVETWDVVTITGGN